MGPSANETQVWVQKNAIGYFQQWICIYTHIYGLPGWCSGKESACNAGSARDARSVPGSGRSPKGGSGNPLQYSCLENSMDRGA